jgi:RHS repeat-associated protein
VRRHDYLPFGEENVYNAAGGSRTAANGYLLNDGVRQQFTGHERDSETGLDFMQARYYSSGQGRFTSVDPEGAGSDPEDPQSWNGYGYARSNPVLLTDPDGRKYRICSADGKECYYHDDDDFYNARRTAKNDGFTFSGSGDFFEGGEIRDKDGNVVATYQQISIDDPTREFIYAMRMSVGDPALVKRSFANAALGAVFFGGLRTNPNKNFSQIDRLSRAAAAPDRGGYTKAGRSLTKHGSGARPGNQKFPDSKGSPTQINRIAQEQVDDILSNPGTTVTNTSKGRFGPTIEYTAPDGRGLVFKANGEFLFFKE